jgi:hypothetical protein
MEKADRIAFELLLQVFAARKAREAGDAVALKSAMQEGARQMRDRWLHWVKAMIERPQRVTSESGDDGLFLKREHRRNRLFRPCLQVSSGTFDASTSRRSSG